MSADKIAEIRARHERIARTWVVNEDVYDAHADRATLLAEVERLTRERDEARDEGRRMRKAWMCVRIDGPDLQGLVWVSFLSQGVAARAHVVVGDENSMASRVALQFREVRRKALEGAP